MNNPQIKRGPNWAKQLQRATRAVERLEPPPVEGVLTRMIGLTLEASGCQAAVGDRCDVLGSGGAHIEAEVVGFSGDRLFLMPTGDIHGLKPNARVIPRTGAGTAIVGLGLAGVAFYKGFVAKRRDERAVVVAPTISRDGAGAALSLRW